MTIELSCWQKQQCALLYFLSSDAYLRELSDKVDSLLQVASEAAELATLQDRDRLIRDPRWGERNTVANWKAHAWPFLLQLRSAMDQTVSARAADIYGQPDFHFIARGVDEVSMDWATPDEERAIRAALAEVGAACATLGMLTVGDGKTRALDDVGLAWAWKEFAGRLPRLPKFQVRTELTAKPFKRPPATGVYIALDDPFASPQFAFAGHVSGYPAHSKTLGYIGHHALRHVGRRALWLDEARMLEFARSPDFVNEFSADVEPQAPDGAHAANTAVAAKAFHSRSCTWTYVEAIPGAYEAQGETDDDEKFDPIITLKSRIMRRCWELTYPPIAKQG